MINAKIKKQMPHLFQERCKHYFLMNNRLIQIDFRSLSSYHFLRFHPAFLKRFIKQKCIQHSANESEQSTHSVWKTYSPSLGVLRTSPNHIHITLTALTTTSNVLKITPPILKEALSFTILPASLKSVSEKNYIFT